MASASDIETLLSRAVAITSKYSLLYRASLYGGIAGADDHKYTLQWVRKALSSHRAEIQKEMEQVFRSEEQPKKERVMKVTFRIVGTILVLLGSVWFLQRSNLLPGSFMTGQIRWAAYGGIAVAAGIGLLLAAKRRNAGR